MEILIKNGNHAFEFDVTPVLLQGDKKCECCAHVGLGIYKTINLDGGVMITNCKTGHNATADFEVGDIELIEAEKLFHAKSREDLVSVMLHYKKINEATAQKIREVKKALFCCNDCWDSYQDLTMATLNREN